jgi:hypothetical protein
MSLKIRHFVHWGLTVQAALVIRGPFICEFAFSKCFLRTPLKESQMRMVVSGGHLEQCHHDQSGIYLMDHLDMFFFIDFSFKFSPKVSVSQSFVVYDKTTWEKVL